MAEFNQLLAQRWNVGVKGLLGLDEQEGLNAVAPELAVMLALEETAEVAFALGWRRGAGTANLPAVAGQVNHHALVNPAGSGVIAIATLMELTENAGAAGSNLILAMIRDTTLGIPTLSSERAGIDSRQVFVSGGNLVCTVESQAAGAALTPRVNFKLLTTTAVGAQTHPGPFGPYILSPGFGVMMITDDLAGGVQSIFNVEWRERAARPSELETE